jgi:hypothetical protein
MFKLFRKINPLRIGRKKRYIVNKLSNYSYRHFKRINTLEEEIYNLKNKLNTLITLSGFDIIDNVIMEESDAKKYKAQK